MVISFRIRSSPCGCYRECLRCGAAAHAKPPSHTNSKHEKRVKPTVLCARSRRRRRAARGATAPRPRSRARAPRRGSSPGSSPSVRNATTPFSVRISRSSRGGPPAARSTAASSSAASTTAPGLRLGERLEVGLDGVDLGTAPRIARSTSSASSCASSSVRSPGSLRWSDSAVRPAERDDAEVVDLPHARHAQRRRVSALAQSRLVARPARRARRRRCRAAPRSSSASTRSAIGMALADGRPRRHGDDDVGERPPGGLPQAQPRQLDRRIDPRDRRARGLLGVRRRAVHEHVHVAADQPRRRHRARARRRRAPRSSRPRGSRPLAATSPARTASVPAKSLPKWIAFESSASLR